MEQERPAACFCTCSLQLRRCDSLDDVRLNLVSNFHVVEVFQTDTALEAFANF